MIRITTKSSSMNYSYDMIEMEDKVGHCYFKPKFDLGIKYIILNGLPIRADNPNIDIDMYSNTISICTHELNPDSFFTIDNFQHMGDIDVSLDVCYMSITKYCNPSIRVLKIDIIREW